MTNNEFKNLKKGNIIRHKTDTNSVVVIANYGNRVTAVRTYDVTNPDEWDVVKGG